MFLYTLSLKKYRNILVHSNNVGLVSRQHGNLHCTPHNRVPFIDVQAIVTFITRFAEIHALPLPGRMPNHKAKALLLPSDISKSEVYRQYKAACTDELLHKPVSWAKFHGIWKSILPQIDTMKPSSERVCIHWTGLLDWTTGLAFHNNVGYQNKGGVNKMQPNKCSMLS